MTSAAMIKNWLVQNIQVGKYSPDDAMPSRHAIMKRFGAARATVDKVYKELIEEGLAYARKGAGTYVAHPPQAPNRLYLIGMGPGGFEVLCSEINGQIDYEIMPREDVEPSFSRMSMPGSRLVWYTPSQSHYGFIEAFRQAGVEQILINRRSQRLPYVTNDTRGGLADAVDWVLDHMPDARWGAILPPLDPAFYYWAEREIMFNDVLRERGVPLTKYERASSTLDGSTFETIKEFLSDDNFPEVVFSPEISISTALANAAKERGIEMGKRLTIVMTDRVSQLTGPGYVSLQQPFGKMQQKVAKWALAKSPKLIQDVIKPTLFTF